MGYRRKMKQYKLQFEGEHEGLEILMRGLTTGEFLEIASMGRKSGDEDSDETSALLVSLADHLISWNMEDAEGNPVPADYEGVKTNDLTLNMLIVNAWTEAVGGVADPLSETSNSGIPSPVAALPMETLSPSQPNLSEPNGSSGSAVSSTFSPA